MAPTVKIWSGREIRALREAQRMSLRDFAAHLGISERMVSKWEAAGEGINPRPVNQAALDSSLNSSSADVQARFVELLGVGDLGMPVGSQGNGVELTGGHNKEYVRHPIDGKLMAFVEGGTFLHGTEGRTLHLTGFYMDVYPTTNADYVRFTKATGHLPPKHWLEYGEPPSHLLNHPVVFVTWHDAYAYASWAAKALPSSPQWEKAARGVRGEVYPWGSQVTPAKCNVREGGIRGTTPVDRYHSGASEYGIYDLCGNVWEWLSSETTHGRYELKGSAFTSPFVRATPSTFNDASADMLDDDTGFRCVSAVETMQSLMQMNA